MYMTSGGVIGLCFLVLLIWRPQQEELAFASVVMMGSAALLLFGSLPWRKALAIGLDYWIDPKAGNERGD